MKAGDVIAYSGERASASGPATPQDREDEAKWEERDRQMMEEELVNGDYPRNNRGQTYGHDFSEYLGYPPDLIPAVSTDGQDGWVSYEMLNGRAEDVMTPEQMAAYQESLKMEGFHVFRYDIPVYDNDGNQIGVFEKGVQMGSYPFKTIEDAREAVANGWPDNQQTAGAVPSCFVWLIVITAGSATARPQWQLRSPAGPPGIPRPSAAACSGLPA